MKKWLMGGVALLVTTVAVAQAEYAFEVDLTKVVNDEVRVNLAVSSALKGKDAELVYHIPKMVPGTYSIYDFGRFISNFEAKDAKGKLLKVEHPDDNTWVIKKAKKLATVSYKVEDTWDAKKPNLPFEPAGTNIEENLNFCVNTHGFFGYFKDKTKLPYTINVKRPTQFFGASAMKRVGGTSDSDVFKADSYNYLADSPIMFSKPDTAMVKVGNADVLIAVYSPTGKVSPKFLKEQIEPTLQAQRKYLGGTLPVDYYAFIIYLTDGVTETGSYGALEHSYSSFYVLPEMEPAAIAQTIRDVAAHEFFHIVTPLNIHSEEIGDFDFINPKMSQHLWMYEGTTEYKAAHVQVMYGLISLEEYLTVVGNKLRESLTTKTEKGKLKYDDKLSFTEMSKEVLVKHKEQYNNVYAKGALIGLCLDINLLKVSNGKYNLNLLMDDLAKEYGKNKSFKDADLFPKIAELITKRGYKPAAVMQFFDNHVIGGKALPLKELLADAGISYFPKKMVKEMTLGGLEKSLGFDGKGFFIANANNLDSFGKSFGFKTGDKLVAWNDKELSMETIDGVLGGFMSTVKEGDAVKVTVEREDKNVDLTTKVIKAEVEKEYVFETNAAATAEQLAFRKQWLGEYREK